MNNNELDNLRDEIQEIDTSLIELLSERMNIVEKVATYKIKNDLSVEDKDREKRLKKFWQEKAKEKNLTESEILVFLETLLKISKNRQEKLI
ncbi:MAG: chorismate mutase [Patescibacteria group bacterium]